MAREPDRPVHSAAHLVMGTILLGPWCCAVDRALMRAVVEVVGEAVSRSVNQAVREEVERDPV